MDKLLNNSLLKLKINTVNTDNHIFRLHYKLMTVVLLAFSVSVTAYQFFGQPIYCIQKDDIPQRLVNTYCWIEGTFTVPKSLNKKTPLDSGYPGVEQREPDDNIVEHAYYQWVCFFLLFQAILFYIPRFIWRVWEGGKIKNLCLGLKNPVLKKEERETKRDILVDYFVKTRNSHGSYAYQHFFCEILNFANTVGQMFFIDLFLGHEFTNYGPEVVNFTMTDQEERLDPMIKVFPRMTKCRFHKFGSSGNVQTHDALCLLPLNIVNEKIFVVLWFCFVILAVLTGLNIIYRLIFIISSEARYMMICSLNSFSSRKDIEDMLQKLTYGNYFLLHLLFTNVDSVHMKEIMAKLRERLRDNLDGVETESSAPPLP